MRMSEQDPEAIERLQRVILRLSQIRSQVLKLRTAGGGVGTAPPTSPPDLSKEEHWIEEK